LHEGLHSYHLYELLLRCSVQEDEMGRPCNAYGRDEKCIQNFSLGNQYGKAVPLQAWSGLEGSRKLRFPDFMTVA